MIVAASLSLTGSMRPGFLVVVIFVLVALVFLVKFDVEKAQEDRTKIEENKDIIDGEFSELRTGVEG